MRTFQYRVQGESVRVYRVENEDDLGSFYRFLREHPHGLAADSETTGLNIYGRDFRIRLAQFGNANEAWVLPVEQGGRFIEAAITALTETDRLVFHNGSYDLKVFEQTLGIPMAELWPKVLDTRILAHLVDPRRKDEGGKGHKLEEVTAAYISEEIAEEVKKLPAKLAKEHKTTKAKIWPLVDLDDPDYNFYAGMDCILAARLKDILNPLVPGVSRSSGLVGWEHKIAEVCSYLERNGVLIDVEYATDLSRRLYEQEIQHEAVAQSYGVELVNSTDQVAAALVEQGVGIPGRTPTGKYKVDSTLLDTLADKGNELAVAVREAKKAHKWRTTWVDGFLANRTEADRVHPAINPLQARTGRMSITRIPAQTLPSSDWMIRRCFLSEPGHRMAAVDYASQELRILAALSEDDTMIRAFERGESLHLVTARTAFGPGVEKDSKQYKWSKTANFQKVYGGGAKGLTAQVSGIDLPTAKKIHAAFDTAYPMVPKLSKHLQREAERNGHIITPVGRVLPVDPGRAYAALNYAVQGTGRDVTCRGLLRAHEAGFTDFLRLPVHDELTASFPEDFADAEVAELAKAMTEQMGPVFIDTDAEVGIRSWGSLYGADY